MDGVIYNRQPIGVLTMEGTQPHQDTHKSIMRSGQDFLYLSVGVDKKIILRVTVKFAK